MSLTEKNGMSFMSSLQSQSLRSLRCNSAATKVKNSNVGPNPVPSSSLNSTLKQKQEYYLKITLKGSNI